MLDSKVQHQNVHVYGPSWSLTKVASTYFSRTANTVLIFHVSSFNVSARIEDLKGYSSVRLKLKKYRWHFQIYEIKFLFHVYQLTCIYYHEIANLVINDIKHLEIRS